MPGIGTNRRRPPATRATPRTPTPRISAVLLAGALVLALGLGLALAWLPEWRMGAFPDRDAAVRAVAAVAARCGVRPFDVRPRLAAVESSERRRLTKGIPLTSTAGGATVVFRAEQEVEGTAPGATAGGETFTVWLDAAGRPLALDARPSQLERGLMLARDTSAPPAIQPERAAAALLAPGESLGPAVRRFVAGFPVDYFPVAGSVAPRHVTAAAVSVFVQASRNPGSGAPTADRNLLDPLSDSAETAKRQSAQLVLACLFGVLAIRRRVALANAAWLAALAAAALLPSALVQPTVVSAVGAVGGVAVASLWLGVLWAAGESLWRAGEGRSDNALDLLRAGRLTRRTGRALLLGVGLGAAAAGLGLGAHALAVRLPGGGTNVLSVDLPVLDAGEGPLATGLLFAAIVACLLAWGRRVSRRRWVPYAAALAAALAFSPVQVRPWPLALAGGVAVAGPLVAAAELGGLAALLAAALAYRLLPAALFSALHLTWMSGGFALAAGTLAVVVTAGLAGARRPAAAATADAAPGEEETVPPPAFVLRLERERRLEVEMELLARMQLGLLPSRLPVVPGWEVAARSLLADRAGGDLYDLVRDAEGRWWLAAGDVAGHGFSCAIAQAMVKAALASLLGPGRSPAEVLAETDRVLRTAAADRTFTSLALLRFDPATGEALLANAGHPYPLLAGPGEPAREVELPGLPLGQGPPRRYQDLPLRLAPGSVLLLFSDGLAEAPGAGKAGGLPYGFERPRHLLDALAGSSAADILDALLADWRRHRGPGAPDDDTTIVVLRRS